MTLLIWPVKGVELVAWSASQELPLPDSFYTERPLYFVTYFYGVQPDVPYELTVTLKVHLIFILNFPISIWQRLFWVTNDSCF